MKELFETLHFLIKQSFNRLHCSVACKREQKLVPWLTDWLILLDSDEFSAFSLEDQIIIRAEWGLKCGLLCGGTFCII